MARKEGPRAYIPTSMMVGLWREAYENVESSSNPYSVRMDKYLRPHGFGVHDIKTRLGIIRGKKSVDRSPDEAELVELDDELKFISEQGLFDKCTETTNGAIFLLESKFGYRKGQDLNVNMDAVVKKKELRWGDEEETVAPAVVDAAVKAVSEG